MGGIAGGIASFLLGWLIYGMLMKDFYAGNCSDVAKSAVGLMREPPIMWALVVGNLGFGFFLSYVFNKWAMISTAGGGAMAGAVIGLLTAIGWDFIMYATMNLSNLTATIVDIIISTVISAIVGAVVGMASGMGNKN